MRDDLDDGADHSSENDPDFCYECQNDLDDCECDLDGPDDHDADRSTGCVLGDACLAVDPFHRSAECFDVEMAEAFMGPAPEPSCSSCGFTREGCVQAVGCDFGEVPR